jgi:hypothetical protein
MLPWAVAGVALVALVLMLASQRPHLGSGEPGGMADAGGIPLAQTGTGPQTGAGGAGGDVLSLPPREQAMRLFNRIMRYDQEGKTDSVQFFAPMAIHVYRQLDTLDSDARYEFGRVAAASGDGQTALAQADTILRASPTHLLGLTLAVRAARMLGQEPQARTFEHRLLAAAPTEQRKNLPEYRDHRGDLDAALAEARRAQ